MQTRGTFPELNAGLTKSSKRANASGKFRKKDTGGLNLSVNGRGPRKSANNPKSFAGRRNASHAAARRNSS